MHSRTVPTSTPLVKPSARPPAKWSLIHSTVVPSNVTLAAARGISHPGQVDASSRKQCVSVPLNPVLHANRWYESPDRSLPSVSSF